MIYRAGKEEDGLLLRTYIRSRLGYSRAALSSLKQKDGGIKVNGQPVTVRTILREGDEIFLDTEDEKVSTGIIPHDIPIEVLYEDEYILAVNKPPFLPVHPARDHQGDTLAGRIMAYFDKPCVFRCATRLDMDTSGVVLVSKDRLTSSKLSDMLSKGEICKKYTLICEKNQKYTEYTLENSGDILYNIRMKSNSFMEREAVTEQVRELDKINGYSPCITDENGDDRDRKRPGEFSPEGRAAVTHYTVISSKGDHKLISARPETGRTHQLRVHFQSMGYSICGDTLYGSSSEYIKRQALHCEELLFIHPILKKEIRIKAPLFSDMTEMIEKIGL